MSFDLQNEELEAIRQTACDLPLVKVIDENNEENKEQNFRIRDIKTMLANGHVEVEEEACLDDGLKFSAVCNSVFLNDATFVDNNKPLVCDIFSFSGNQAEEIVPTDVKFEIDDDDNFDLSIPNDDENEIPEIKVDSKIDLITTGDECSLRQLDTETSEHVTNQSYLSTNLEYVAGSNTVEKLITATASVTTSSAIDDRTSRNREAVYDCVWCPKLFPTKKSLKYHILYHLRASKQDAKDDYLSTSEIDEVAVDDINANVSSHFACVFCEKSFPNKKTLIIHYINVHRQPDTQIQSRPKRTALNGPYWQLCDNKTPDAAATASVIPGSTEESSASIDENCISEDASKQYKCYICDKQFSRNSSLMWHIQFHENCKYPKLEKNNADSDPVVVDVNGETDAIHLHDDNISSVCTSEKYTCNICDCHFTHRSNFHQHMKLAHPESSEEMSPLPQKTSGHKCETCGKFFSTVSNMRKHVRRNCKGPLSIPESEEDDENAGEDPLKEFPCDICNRSFFSKRAVNIHRSYKHRDELSDTVANDTRIDDLIPCDSYAENEGSFQCNVCEKTFETRKGVIRHIGYHRSAVNESIKSSVTSINGISDEESDDVDGAEDNVPCPQCGKTFGSIRGMRIHANKHIEKKVGEENEDDSDIRNKSHFECHLCDKSFEGFRSYKIHTSWHSRREEIGAVRPTKSDKSETVDPQTKSDKSEAVTLQKKPEKNTPSTYTAAKIHQCQYCTRWYTTQQALAGHMKAHQSLRIRSDQPQDNAHQSSRMSPPQGSHHSENRITTCQICGQNFSSNSNFGEHMRLHIAEAEPATSSGQPLTLEDTMECDICGKFFMRKQDMAKHMRDHINGTITRENVDLNLFSCIHCPKSFVGRKSLLTHQRLHEEAQVALKRAADELLTDTSHPKQRRLSELEAHTEDDSVGWDNMTLGHQCEKCDRILSSKQSLQRHMEWHAKMREMHGLSTSSTSEAAVATATSSTQEIVRNSFDEHSRLQDEEPDTVVVNDLEALGEHAVVQCIEDGKEEYFVFDQREGEAFQCSECDETHFDKLQMIVHMAYHVGKRLANGRQRSLIIKADPIMLAPFECMFCDERFVNKVFRSRHVAKRHGDNVVQCNACRKLFLSRKRLAVHCQQHFSDPIYRCERCLKCFTSKWFLKRHARKLCAGEYSQEIKEEQNLPTSDVESSNDE